MKRSGGIIYAAAIVVLLSGSNPGCLKYNGGGPVFLCGPDNPEDFLHRGELNRDGTRSGGGQEEAIERMARAGVSVSSGNVAWSKPDSIGDEVALYIKRQ